MRTPDLRPGPTTRGRVPHRPSSARRHASVSAGTTHEMMAFRVGSAPIAMSAWPAWMRASSAVIRGGVVSSQVPRSSGASSVHKKRPNLVVVLPTSTVSRRDIALLLRCIQAKCTTPPYQRACKRPPIGLALATCSLRSACPPRGGNASTKHLCSCLPALANLPLHIRSCKPTDRLAPYCRFPYPAYCF